MSDRLRAAAANLAARVRSDAGNTITYARGASTVSVTATLGRTIFRTSTEYGVTRTVSRDYLITADDLQLGGVRVIPVRGDRITEVDPRGDSRTYEVLAPGGEDVWRYSDAQRQILRVHTMEVTSVK